MEKSHNNIILQKLLPELLAIIANSVAQSPPRTLLTILFYPKRHNNNTRNNNTNSLIATPFLAIIAGNGTDKNQILDFSQIDSSGLKDLIWI